MGLSIRLLAAVCVGAHILAAQTSTSAITGTVTDSSGAIVPGSTVTLSTDATGVTAKQKTNQAGVYSFASLAIGQYSITVELKGFRTVRNTGNKLSIGAPIDIPITLQIGETAEVMTIAAAIEALQTKDASIGNVVSQKEISELPLNGRNPLALLVLEPGVVQMSKGAVRRRFQNGMLFGLAYTLHKSIDDQSVDPIGASSGGGLSTTNTRTPASINNWRNERAQSSFDRRQLVVVTWIYEMPFGKNLPKPLRFFAAGWAVNGLFNFMSGNPFSVMSGTRTANYSHQSRAALEGAQPEVKLTDVPGIIGPVYFAGLTSGFKAPAPGSDGMGRNTFTAPSFWNLDSGLTKFV